MSSLATLVRRDTQPLAFASRTATDSTAVIIGAGLGGLSAAIHLRLAGWQVIVFEANSDRRGAGESAGARRLPVRQRSLPAELPLGLRGSVPGSGPPDAGLRPAAAGRSVRHLPMAGRYAVFPLERPAAAARGMERVEPGVSPSAIAYLQDAAEKYRLAFEGLVTANDTGYVRWLQRAGRRRFPRLSLWRSMDAQLRRYFRGGRIADALGSYAMYLRGISVRAARVLRDAAVRRAGVRALAAGGRHLWNSPGH